jgi:hypothetical protein
MERFPVEAHEHGGRAVVIVQDPGSHDRVCIPMESAPAAALDILKACGCGLTPELLDRAAQMLYDCAGERALRGCSDGDYLPERECGAKLRRAARTLRHEQKEESDADDA